MSDKKYKREKSAFWDKQQTKLNSNGISPNAFIYAEISIPEKLRGKKIACPFCLNSSEFFEYEKIDKIIVKCPHCKNKMHIKTLEGMLKFSIPEYANWVFNYRLSGFFDKIDFKAWNYKMYILGISKEFWDNYKRLKGEYKNENE